MTQSKKQNNTLSNGIGATTAEVLYQRIGGKWYAFSVVNEEVYMSPISDDLLSEINPAELIHSHDEQKTT